MSPLHTRRQFLRHSALGGSLVATVPSFIAATFDQLNAAESKDKDAPILVVLQLAGGNDGLNTVVPFANDHYQKARPTLGLKPSDVLRIDDAFGFHPALKGFKSLHDDGLMGVLHAVGYPNPNRSHFRSAEIWATASDSQRVEQHGWLGRYFDHACSGADPTVGIAIGRQQPQAFAANSPKGISLDRPENFRYVEGEDESMAYREMAGTMDAPNEFGAAGGSIQSLPGTATASVADPRSFLERTALDAQVSSDLIRRIAQKNRTERTYPTTALGQSLKLIASLISGGLSTRVYYASQGGYDTHTRQKDTHERLLRELGEATQAFLGDLKAQGVLDRVLMITFSEFGRRVAENGSNGTDHGAGAPVFVFGGKVRPGLHGTPPDLSPTELLRGDIRHRIDFRQVYATVLERWLKTPSQDILKRKFDPLEFLS
jgi:uncharacterized protein (DUF1501 family)